MHNLRDGDETGAGNSKKDMQLVKIYKANG